MALCHTRLTQNLFVILPCELIVKNLFDLNQQPSSPLAWKRLVYDESPEFLMAYAEAREFLKAYFLLEIWVFHVKKRFIDSRKILFLWQRSILSSNDWTLPRNIVYFIRECHTWIRLQEKLMQSVKKRFHFPYKQRFRFALPILASWKEASR